LDVERLKKKYRRNARFYDLTEVSPLRRLRADAVRRLTLKPGETVLDLGCGTGLSLPLLERAIGPRGHIVGVDLSPDMLGRARERVARHGWQNVTLIEANAEETDLRPNSVDAVLCFYAQDVMNSPHAIGRAVGTLRPGGRFIAAGGKRAGGWRRLLIDPITLASLSPFVADPSLKARPWSDLERFVGPLEVEERLWGSGYLACGVKGDHSPT
jgi:ubiquinone/menaquinone biosynthesis C-methylase UbiE